MTTRTRNYPLPALDGHKRTTIFEPQVRFNWGFHDAHMEVARGNPRSVVSYGPQTLGAVSAEYDPAYHAGYSYGRMSEYATDELSTNAWESFQAASA